MSRRIWQRPLILAVASVVLAAGTACAAQASSGAVAGTGHAVLAGQSSHCGRGGEGGEGGRGGEPGRPGKPGMFGCFRFGDLPDKSASELTVVDKIRIVLSVESGQAKKAGVARKYKISEKEIGIWDRRFRDGDWAALMGADSLFGS